MSDSDPLLRFRRDLERKLTILRKSLAAAGPSRVLAAWTILLLATVGLFLVSRGKWSDALIDSGREWIVPDALARGELLYRDVVYWFGPFTPYFHAAFFKLFGSSFRTLVIAGVVGSLGVLAALYFALRSVTGKLEAALWTALAVPVLVFMPNAGGPILGMGYRIWHAAAFSLVAVALASRPVESRHLARRAAAAGALCAMAGLCRMEWGVAALVATLLATALSVRSRENFRGQAVLVAAAFVLLFGGTTTAFILAAGWKAVVEDGHVLLTGLPQETRRFLVAFSGVRDWRAGLAEMAYSAAMWVGVFALVELWAARREPGVMRRRLPTLAALLLFLVVAALFGGAGGAVLYSAAPALCLVASLITAWKRDTRAAALAGFGFLGVVLSYRRPFHITDSAYVGPPLLFAFVCSAGLASVAVVARSPAEFRPRLEKAIALTLAGLIAFAFIGRAQRYLDDPRVPVEGTEQMLFALPAVAREIAAVAAAIRLETAENAGAVAIPEGEILNRLSERRNPMRYKLYLPGYLSRENEAEVASDLLRAQPAAVVLWSRPTSEYGVSSIGLDYGLALARVIENHCEFRPLAARRRGSQFRYGLCRW